MSKVDETALENVYRGMMRFDSGQRMAALLTPGREKQYALEEQTSRLTLARAVIQNYNSCDQVTAFREDILELLRFHYKECGTFCEEPDKPHLSPQTLGIMGGFDNTKWDDIPDEVTIYRGADERETRRWGISWTLDEGLARRFPFLMRHKAANPILLTVTIRKNEAFAFIFSRNEKEVLVDPERLAGVKVERLEP